MNSSVKFKHFVYYIFSKIFFLNDSKLGRRLFVIIFNLFSIIKNSSNRIFIKKNFYYNTEMDWRFYHKKQGLYAYSSGFKKRREELISSYLIKNLKFEDNDIIIDIGANNGDFFLCFDKKINYYAFEPSPIVFSNLKYNVKNQNLYNLGVSNESEKKVEFYLSDEFGDSSIIPIKNFTNKINIETTTLDNIINKIQKKIKIIKLEAEGFETEILTGLKQYINHVEYITIDCGFERGVNNESTKNECNDYLIKRNFKLLDVGKYRIVTLYKNMNL